MIVLATLMIAILIISAIGIVRDNRRWDRRMATRRPFDLHAAAMPILSQRMGHPSLLIEIERGRSRRAD
jgi:hypothetical protein